MSENLLVNDKQIVVPGEILANDARIFRPGRGTVKTPDNQIQSVFVGLVQIRKQYINVVPLNGVYIPSVGDKVIARVEERTVVKWILDINAHCKGILRPRDAIERDSNRRGGRRRGKRMSPEEEMSLFDLGDVIAAKITSFSRTSEPDLSTLGKGLGKLKGGVIMKIPSPKIPRVIGRRGSMIKMLKDQTHCKISVAQNGRIWIRGRSRDDELLAVKVIEKIDREAHTSGLTDRIKEFIKNERKAN